jgi:hypothetical protein
VKPYYEDDGIVLYHGDCREIDAWLTADVLVTDPPYGVAWKQRLGDARNVRQQTHVRNVVQGDTDTTLRDAALSLWTGPTMVFGSWRVTRPDGVRSLLIWNKAGSFSGPLNAAFFTNHEEIYVIGEGWRRSAPPLRSVITSSEHRSSAARESGHPTPKPVGLMQLLIDRCPPGVIADPFAGSGSTLVAAKLQGRNAIGVEVEERYCEIAARRLDQGVLDFGSAS